MMLDWLPALEAVKQRRRDHEAWLDDQLAYEMRLLRNAMFPTPTSRRHRWWHRA